MKLSILWLLPVWLLTSAPALAAAPEPTQAYRDPAPVFATDGRDTLRTNLWVAEALLANALADLSANLPPPPGVILLVPGTTEPATSLLTDVATNRLQQAGYQVHLDQTPAGTEMPVVELRYRVNSLGLRYPQTGRRLGIWKSWVGRQMACAAQFTAVDRNSGQILVSRRLSYSFQDRVPQAHLAAVESADFPFTKAQPQASGWTRRLEEFVVLGTLAGLVAVYFANVE